MSIYGTVVILLYQWWFAASYIVSQLLGLFIGNIFFKLFFLFGACFPSLTIGSGNKLPRASEDISVHMCYPYYQFWRAQLTMSSDIKMRFPTCPLLYLVKIHLRLLSLTSIWYQITLATWLVTFRSCSLNEFGSAPETDQV